MTTSRNFSRCMEYNGYMKHIMTSRGYGGVRWEVYEYEYGGLMSIVEVPEWCVGLRMEIAV